MIKQMKLLKNVLIHFLIDNKLDCKYQLEIDLILISLILFISVL